MSERIKHPSYANLYIGRSQCSGQQALFGSSIKHHDITTLRISPAYMDDCQTGWRDDVQSRWREVLWR